MYKLICFDVDGTLIDNFGSAWQLFHDHFGIDQKKREENKARFFDKKISYEEWAKLDILMWIEKGVTKKDFIDAMVHYKVRMMPGALETVTELKKRGMKLAVISGSIDIVLEYMFPEYGSLFDDVFISRIKFGKDGKISGFTPSEFDMEGKAKALKIIAKRENLMLSECVFIGDHHNDIAVAKEAGLSIAFDAKDDRLRDCSSVIIDKKDLKEILRYIG